MPPPLISARDLTKTYVVRSRKGGAIRSFFSPEVRRIEALQGVSFDIAPGELVGYIGPNGAGKSTTVKILSGILVPDGGQCTVMGMTPWKSRVKYVSRIGVVFGQRSQLWWDLPVIDSFTLLKDIYNVPAGSFKSTRDELIDRLELSPLIDMPVRQLSLGQRMRCEIAASLLHSPDILFLDEPTIGLDALSKIAIRDFILSQNRTRGVSVMLTTHDMNDIEALCSRVMLIGEGKILSDGSIEDLKRSASERIMTADLDCPAPDSLALPVMSIQSQGRRAIITYAPESLPTTMLISYLTEMYGIREVSVADPSIEDIIARRYFGIKAGSV